ncbi:hypothetical protein I302_105312 [Kwoniella bestiolae CBS 10118]|uniref:Uncharacterized protein n=1 Tax=Kwoniella bestiolae CBS 10118 TaxID=1296100 RepID=A0AAJ8M8Z5_9TREE
MSKPEYEFYRCYEVTYQRPWWEYHDEIQHELNAFDSLVMFRPHVMDNKHYLSFGKSTQWSEEEKVKLKGMLEKITASFRLYEEYESDNFRIPCC